MMAIIEVQSGPSKGYKQILREGQEVEFGRTEWADVVLPDEKMSGVHFAVEANEGRLVLRDRDSTNGTILNGEYVKEAVLGSGDEFVAGQTHFIITIRQQSATWEEVPGKNSGATGGATMEIVRDLARLPPDMADKQIACDLEHCESGLVLFRGGEFGQPDQPSTPSEVAARLAYRWPQYLIVDFQKAELPIPEGLTDPAVLFDWLPEEVAVQNSPLVVPPLPELEVAGLIDGAWDKDAVICLYTEQPADTLVAHLREATRYNIQGRLSGEGQPKSMLGYCWPGVLAQLLAFRSSEFAERLLNGIEAVLQEVPDFAGTWQLFGRGDLPQHLTQLEIKQMEPGAEETAEGSGDEEDS